MAHCVISAILDTDVDAMVPACMVHTSHAPCMHDGEPANPAPLHAFNCSEREDAIRMWRIRTHRQRPLIIHDERRIPDPADHVLEDEIRPCPCGAEVLAAEAPGGRP
jgi:hypothetical protein